MGAGASTEFKTVEEALAAGKTQEEVDAFLAQNKKADADAGAAAADSKEEAAAAEKRLFGRKPDPETGLSELWEGLVVLLTALADSAWLDGTLVVVTADRGRDRDGLPSSGAAALVAGGPVLAGRAFDATGGTDLQVGGPGSARPGWGELWAGALAACGRSHALPGTASWTAWWS